MNTKSYKQTTYESCLAFCLLMLLDKKPTRSEEINTWKRGWKFNYLLGQLNYFSRKHKKHFNIWVENTYYFKELKKKECDRINLINQKIDIRLIKSLLNDEKLIIYLDGYYMHYTVHYAHFILGMKIDKENKIETIDPYAGKAEVVPFGQIKKGIISLRNHLKFSPILIQERKENRS